MARKKDDEVFAFLNRMRFGIFMCFLCSPRLVCLALAETAEHCANEMPESL